MYSEIFTIKFKIIDNIEMLKKISLAEFEQEHIADIRGLFLLNFNGKTYGYLENDLPPTVEDILAEWLIIWFQLLNKVVKKLTLDKHTYVALHPIEDAYTWIEFIKIEKDELLTINLIEVEPIIGSRSVIVTERFDTYTYGSWNNVKIPLSDFVDEVVNKTQTLISLIKSINPILLKSKNIQRLIDFSGAL